MSNEDSGLWWRVTFREASASRLFFLRRNHTHSDCLADLQAVLFPCHGYPFYNKRPCLSLKGRRPNGQGRKIIRRSNVTLL